MVFRQLLHDDETEEIDPYLHVTFIYLFMEVGGTNQKTFQYKTDGMKSRLLRRTAADFSINDGNLFEQVVLYIVRKEQTGY